MTTFSDLKLMIIHLMGDTVALDDNGDQAVPLAGGTLTADLLKDACYAAFRSIVPRQWKSALFEITEVGDLFELPTDLIEIDAVLDNTLSLFIPKMVFTIGVDYSSLASTGNSWIDTPQGSITFSNELGASGAKVYYSAAWSLISTDPSGAIDDDSVLEAPDVCLTALTLYAASYCFLKNAALQSQLGQFKTRVDSGTPEDLPAVRMSEVLLKRFENEMTRVPMKQKGSQ